MDYKLSRILFILVFALCAVNVFGQKTQTSPCDRTENGFGFAGDKAMPEYNFVEKPKVYPVGTRPLQIISKPVAVYSEPARENCIQGAVVLKITFYANAQVGNIKVVKGLPYGLSEQAVEAAKRIRFKPQMKRGKLVSITKKVRYNFTIY